MGSGSGEEPGWEYGSSGIWQIVVKLSVCTWQIFCWRTKSSCVSTARATIPAGGMTTASPFAPAPGRIRFTSAPVCWRAPARLVRGLPFGMPGARCAVITDETVAALYADARAGEPARERVRAVLVVVRGGRGIQVHDRGRSVADR